MGANFELRTGQVLQEKIVGTDNYRERYKIGQKVGSGSFGVTHKVLITRAWTVQNTNQPSISLKI